MNYIFKEIRVLPVRSDVFLDDDERTSKHFNISRNEYLEMQEIAIAGLRVLTKAQVSSRLEKWATKAGIKVISSFSMLFFNSNFTN